MADRAVVLSFLYGDWPEDRPELGDLYVERLLNGVMRNTTLPFDFRLYVDRARYDGARSWVRPIPEDFAGLRWNLKKISMFSEEAGLKGYSWALCLDLDLVITGNIDFLLAERSRDLIVCRGAYTDAPGGSIVGFDPNQPWTENLAYFCANQRQVVEADTRGSERKYYRAMCGGDGYFGRVSYWQDLYPGRVLSYKVDGYLPGASVVRFHGSPRPHEVQEAWVKEYWG